MPSTVVLYNTTAAEASDPFSVNAERTTFVASGTYAGTESAVLQVKDHLNAWVDVVIEGTTQELSVSNTALTVYGVGTFRFNKSSSAAAAGVSKAG